MIQHVAVEYIGHVGLIVGYAANTVISHNFVANLTYGGLSVGWGWTLAPTFCHNNTISYNDIGYYKRPASAGLQGGLQDGGGKDEEPLPSASPSLHACSIFSLVIG